MLELFEPFSTTLWTYPFKVNATVFYITEPCTPETLFEICTNIRYLTIKNTWRVAYFLVLFPNASTVLFFSPQKAICNAIVTGDLSPALTDVKQRITETAILLIKEYCSERGPK